ncbi:E3 ubiquitin protein ligase RIN2-like isoform X2 [Phalaenopsis equestris]|uniref:E3 ubiquitin protein ligase RIN2-like isoform X2 n=1 Tax=Phalaenopsis equestris TaxID=78828 RepID=UPI0009E5C582|nr:E3 ubiquitin protein ligase RIN2-like isoform X2 [Phalaenopsis equestris]
MSAPCVAVSAIFTMLSLIGLRWWMFSLLGGNGRVDFGHTVELLVHSKIAIALLLNLAVNVYILVALALKAIFFEQIYLSEYQKVLEQHVDYVLYKGTLLPLVVPPTISQMVLWSIWLVVLCSFKIFQSLVNARLELLYISPTVTLSKYFRLYSALVLVLAADLFWIRLCMVAYTFFGSTLFLLSFFEPLNIAFETLLALTVHGFYSTEIWKRRSIDNGAYCLASLDFYKSIEGQKGTLNRNCSFLLDFLALSMSVGHYLMIWWLQGTSFFLVNTVLFVYLCRILNKMVKRVRCFINLKNDPISIGEAFPDATDKDLSVFDDQCAICRGPMAKAKKLPCNHLFHLDCLKLWLDQGCTEAYSCPTCRGLLFVSSSENKTNSLASQVPDNAHIAGSINPFPAAISIQPSTR